MRFLFLAVSLMTASAAGAVELELVDDRGEAIEAPLRVCFVQDLETDCHDLENAAEGELALQPFDLLRVEGPRHGPVTVRPDGLSEAEDGRRRLAVPRKARLRIAGLPDDPSTLSLYGVDDPDARRPGFQIALEPSDSPREIFIPAGEHLASISRRGAAPDLHALAAPPGGALSVGYRERSGWSLALRAVDPATGKPVPGAVVELAPPPVPESVAPELPSAEAGGLGFALFSGLAPPMVHATVRHGEFVATEVLGLSASPGTFDLHHVSLERGGTVEAQVTVDGEPATGALCRTVEWDGRFDAGAVVVETLQEAPVDRSGVCRIERVAAGARFLRVVLDDETAAVVDRKVQVLEGETTRVDVELSPIRVSGVVYRGDEPAGSGYVIAIAQLRAAGPAGTRDPEVSVSTDDSGEYAATLWTPSEYYLQVTRSGGSGYVFERAFLSQATEAIDFHLSDREIRGRVVDPDGEPVPDAFVSFTWNRRSHTGAQSGADGESDGQGRLVLAGVAPGEYELFLRKSSNEYTVAQGLRHGFVTSTTLAPLTATDLEVVVDDVA
jgi:hypothetical protein